MMTSAGAEALGDMLRVNTTLTYLDISWNKIDDEGIRAIAYALSDNNTLTYINITSNKITDSGAQVMIHLLKSNNTLLNLQIIYGNNLFPNLSTNLRSIGCNLNIV
jgi:Ran GTPase-activating protein (RanGAP) involved in mRNA processing and transport